MPDIPGVPGIPRSAIREAGSRRWLAGDLPGKRPASRRIAASREASRPPPTHHHDPRPVNSPANSSASFPHSRGNPPLPRGNPRVYPMEGFRSPAAIRQFPGKHTGYPPAADSIPRGTSRGVQWRIPWEIPPGRPGLHEEFRPSRASSLDNPGLPGGFGAFIPIPLIRYKIPN